MFEEMQAEESGLRSIAALGITKSYEHAMEQVRDARVRKLLGDLAEFIADFRIAFTVALLAVIVELAAISYIRHRYMDTPLFSVMLGGTLVFITGLLIGNS
jgi:hypothetical protein